MSESVNHHFVSQGYQANFADEQKRVAIVRTVDGWSPTKLRAVRSNWYEPHFNTMFGENGEVLTQLEAEYSKVETAVLHTIRGASPLSMDDDMRGAIISLFAMHLVRSIAMRDAQQRVYAENIDELIADVEGDQEAAQAFFVERGRWPRPGEIAAIARQIADDRRNRRIWQVEGMANQYNKIGDMLSKYAVQIVHIVSPDIGSFVLGDVPVVHANRADGRFGLRDGLAVGDADFLGAPLTRITAASITARRLPPHPVKTKKHLDRINYAFIRGAQLEVLCHPDDQLATQRLCRNKPRPLPALP